MYKLLLCWRYLWTRYLALVCIVSVMLGVATLIVVNSVMSGFSTKLKQRLHGLLSDVLVESTFQDGFADPEQKIERIRQSPIGGKIEAMTPAIETLGLIQFTYRGQLIAPRTVRLIGVDPKGRARLGGFAEYLTDPRNQSAPSFELRPEARRWHEQHYPPVPVLPAPAPPLRPGQLPPPTRPAEEPKEVAGAFIGYSIAHYREQKLDPADPDQEITLLNPGDEVIVYTVSGERLKPVYDNVVLADFFKSEMSEYDANYAFVPLDWLQRQRTMEGRATCIQIKLKDYGDARDVVEFLRRMFPSDYGYRVETWEQKQGALLAAIAIEKGILNVLLFLIICVAGFGILAIFSMIVVEKTRDIGILKALGASNGGVMGIFLGYGLLLGLVGATLGTGMGLTITIKINEIEALLSKYTGHEIFDRSVYYFKDIPTHTEVMMVLLVNMGALVVAIVFSVLPALRAAMLHPVRALRYE